jgi:DNA replication protein DnaC
MVHPLPANPPAVRSLSTAEYEHLKSMYPDLWTDPNSSCLTCDKKGVFLTLVKGEEVEMECDCIEQWLLHLWMLNAGIGLAYQRLGWDHATNAPPNAFIETLAYLDNAKMLAGYGQGLTLASTSRGTGKTLLLTLALRRMMGLGMDGFFCQFNQLLTLHTAGWRDNDARKWFERRVMNAGVLGIDDMGKENANRGEMVGALVDEILRTRILNSRPTLITTNLTQDELADRYFTDAVELFSGSNKLIIADGVSYRESYLATMDDYAKRGLRMPVVIG